MNHDLKQTDHNIKSRLEDFDRNAKALFVYGWIWNAVGAQET